MKWTLDFCFDQITNLKTLKAVGRDGEFTRRSPRHQVDRSIAADDTVAVLETHRGNAPDGPPEFLRTDNGHRDHRPRPSATGAGSHHRHHLHRAGHPRRARTSSRLPASCATSCSTCEAFETLLRGPRPWPRTTASTTTPTDPTRRSDTGPRHPSPPSGPDNRPESHRGWYRNRGQVTRARPRMSHCTPMLVGAVPTLPPRRGFFLIACASSRRAADSSRPWSR